MFTGPPAGELGQNDTAAGGNDPACGDTDGTGTLQKDWDTGLHLEMYPEGFSWAIALSSRQKEGYAVFAITEPLGRNEMLYQLNLTTGEVTQTED